MFVSTVICVLTGVFTLFPDVSAVDNGIAEFAGDAAYTDFVLHRIVTATSDVKSVFFVDSRFCHYFPSCLIMKTTLYTLKNDFSLFY